MRALFDRQNFDPNGDPEDVDLLAAAANLAAAEATDLHRDNTLLRAAAKAQAARLAK